MKTNKLGYTTVELITTLAIVSTLAAASIPSYMDYLKTAKVVRGISVATKAKIAVSQYYQYKDKFPTTNIMSGLGEPESITDDNVSSVEVGEDGIITIKYKTTEDNGVGNMALTLQLTPIEGEDLITWKIGSFGEEGVPAKWCTHTMECLGTGS